MEDHEGLIGIGPAIQHGFLDGPQFCEPYLDRDPAIFPLIFGEHRGAVTHRKVHGMMAFIAAIHFQRIGELAAAKAGFQPLGRVIHIPRPNEICIAAHHTDEQASGIRQGFADAIGKVCCQRFQDICKARRFIAQRYRNGAIAKRADGVDVIIAALLGAEEFGFATTALVVEGCVMMRVCHLDTCPVGVATQNPELRKKFTGKPEFVVNFFEYIAEEVRELLAQLGFRSLEEAIGQAECLDIADAVAHWKADGLDLTPILHVPELPEGALRHQATGQEHGLEEILDRTLIAEAAPALADGSAVAIRTEIGNVDRSTGTMLGYELTRRFGGEGLPDDTITIDLNGSAGNSFGAFVPRGITLRLVGDANDYLGKGLSGGRITVRPPEDSPFRAEEQVIAGNVILYGATGGEAFIRGVVGERFCVRNSGALAVVEGIGDHGCEYMTGGRAVVLGPTGRNFAAGMSGGIAFVLDEDRSFAKRVNPEMVILEDLDEEDADWLRDVLARHHAETGSEVAERLQGSWPEAAGTFRKVMPTDYRRVLEAASAARSGGRDEVEAIMASTRA